MGIYTKRRRHALARSVAATALVAVTATWSMSGTGPRAEASDGDSPISGRVFRDYNANGTFDAADEPAQGGIVVALYDDAGHSSSTTSADDGSWSVPVASPMGDGAAHDRYRVEFTIPTALSFLQPGPEVDDPSGHGTTDAPLTSDGPVVVAAAGDTDVNFAVNDPSDYCGTAPDVVVSCFLFGHHNFDNGTSTGADNPALASFGWNDDGDRIVDGTDPIGIAAADVTTVAPIGTTTQSPGIGSVFGLGYSRSENALYSAAFQKRHVGFGAGGTGGIYRTDRATGETELYVDVNAVMPAVPAGRPYAGSPAAGPDPHPDTAGGNWFNDVRDPADTSIDSWAASHRGVAKIGLGDVEISADGTQLYTVNLATAELYTIDLVAGDPITTPAEASRIAADPIPTEQCAADSDAMAFGLSIHDGELFVGVTCTGESTGSASDVSFHIYTYDPSRAVPWEHEVEVPWTATNPSWSSFAWKDWDSSWIGDGGSGHPALASTDTGEGITFLLEGQRYLSDIEWDGQDMIVGFRTRHGDQGSSVAGWPDARFPTVITAGASGGVEMWNGASSSSGDIMRACWDGSAWVVESGAVCGGTAGSADSESAFGGPTQSWFDDRSNTVHPEGSLGGLATFQGSHKIATSANAITGSYISDVAWLNLDNGSSDVGFGAIRGGAPSSGRNGQSVVVYEGPGFGVDPGPNVAGVGFGKAAGLGDVELLCDNAPVEIGDYVWLDTDGDGRQDPGEDPIAGVEVTLDDGLGHSSTITTDANGRYRFAGLTPNLTYTVSITVGQPSLAGLAPTSADALAEGGADGRDSDGVRAGTSVTATAAVGAAGHNDHSFDFGFRPGLALGNLVWLDVDDDGTVDAGEAGIEGVAVRLYQGATLVASTVTDADGHYLFDGLDPGDYEVEITAPAGLLSSAGGGTYEPAPDPDDDTDNVDDGTTTADPTVVRSGVVTLSTGGEPTSEDGDNTSNLTVDFGLHAPSTNPELSLVKKLAGMEGTTAAWQIDVLNAGDGPATDVVLVDELPEGLDALDATGDGWQCDVEANVFTCELDHPLAVGETGTVTVRTEVTGTGMIRNVASVEAAEDEANLDNNVGGDELTVDEPTTTTSTTTSTTTTTPRATTTTTAPSAGAASELAMTGSSVFALVIAAAVALVAGAAALRAARNSGATPSR